MATKLGIYKGALRILGERSVTLTEARPSRYALDEIWDDGFRDLVLSAGFWNFAMRTVEIQYTGDVEPDFGYSRAFDKPTDWIRTAAVSADEYFNTPLNQYADEQDYWFADHDTLYFKFVSSHADYGYDLSRWPANFTRFAQHLMAAEGAERITQNRVKKADVMKLADDWLSKAMATDAQNQPVSFPPTGSWVNARRGGSSGMSRYNGGWRRD